MNMIQLSNFRTWSAVAMARTMPAPDTRAEVFDALNQRRNMRARYHAPTPPAVSDEISRQVRAWGRVEDWQAVTNAGRL